MTETKKPSLGDKLKGMIAAYGPVAFGVYLAIFALVFGGAAIALRMGFEFESAAGSAGTMVGAYVVTKVAQPLRILATLALTPVVATLIGRKPKDVEDQKPSM